MTNTPVEFPERHPRTRITRLPYLLVALVALAIAAFIGSITWRDRMTAEREVVGLQVGDATTTSERLNQPDASPPTQQAVPTR